MTEYRGFEIPEPTGWGSYNDGRFGYFYTLEGWKAAVDEHLKAEGEYREIFATQALAKIRDRLNRPIHPYGDEKFPKIPEIDFLRDAYGEDLPNDIMSIIDSVLES